MCSQPAGNTTATPPGCFRPSAPTIEATVHAPGSTAVHSAAAYASQCVSCGRQGRPRSNRLTMTARLAAALR
eukprot:15463159-Alexandrium_andersonii.AAC.1